MFNSFAASRSEDFKSWSDAHPPASNDDDDPTGPTAAALAVLSFDDVKAAEQPGCPRVVPAVSVSL